MPFDATRLQRPEVVHLKWIWHRFFTDPWKIHHLVKFGNNLVLPDSRSETTISRCVHTPSFLCCIPRNGDQENAMQTC